MRAGNNTPHDSSMICCGRLPKCSRCQGEALPLMASPERPSGRTIASAAGGKFTPSTIMSPAATSSSCPSTEIRLGVHYYRAHKPTASHPRALCERAPPKSGSISKYKPCTPRLTRGSFTDKEQRNGGLFGAVREIP